MNEEQEQKAAMAAAAESADAEENVDLENSEEQEESTGNGFAEFGLSQTTLDALAAKGITEPTPIQAASIPLLLSGERDVLGQARTGTGKTAAFGIPIIETLRGRSKVPEALVLTPTRELCMQVATEIKSLCGDKKIFIEAVYGGAAIETQIRALKRGVDIVVGTPGRVQDLIDRGVLVLDNLQFAVLDEADEMLDMGFVDDIRKILEIVPEKRRMLMFSATMPAEIMAIAEQFMRNCEVIRVDAEPAKLDQVERYGYEVLREGKVEALIRLMDVNPDMYALVFCRTRADVDELCAQLSARHHHVEALHGDITQAQRTKVIHQFKEGYFRILVATDVAARGIDVNGLTHVINFSLPQNAEIYIHRIGRTGRAGHKGTAITFVTPGERRKLADIEREMGSKLEFRTLPTPEELIEAHKASLIKRITEFTACPEYEEIAGELLGYNPPDKTIAALLRIAYGNKFIASSYPHIALPQRLRKTERFGRGEKRPFRREDGEGKRPFRREDGEERRIFRREDGEGKRPFRREIGEDGASREPRRERKIEHNPSFIRVGVGRGFEDGLNPKILLEMIFNAVKITAKRLGKINIYEKCGYIEVPPSLATKIINGVNGHTHSKILRIAEIPTRKKF